MSIKDYVNGLYVKDGRLVNSRPCSISGIEEAANIRKATKRARKVEEIAEGIRIADEMKTMDDIMRGKRF